MTRALSLLGSTGSVGRQTLKVAKALGIPVLALTGNENIALLARQAAEFRPKVVAVTSEEAAKRLKSALSGLPVRVLWGESGLIGAATAPGADTVLTAVSGSVGLAPTLAAIDQGLRVALANKETLVCAGELVMKRARERGVDILPVDSEHSAIFQCLQGERRQEVSKILLTASGGPFRGLTREQTKRVTPQAALRHPSWSMGPKISVDSATMMNKGLELIEAMHLFSLPPEQIEILIHPESVVHSMVAFQDGSVMAQLARPDMALPIQYALTWPDRLPGLPAPDFAALGCLTFQEPDLENSPCLALAIQCARRGGTAPALLSAANEEAVALFLSGRIGYNEIYEFVASAVDSIETGDASCLESVLEADKAARRHVRKVLETCS